MLVIAPEALYKMSWTAGQKKKKKKKKKKKSNTSRKHTDIILIPLNPTFIL